MYNGERLNGPHSVLTLYKQLLPMRLPCLWLISRPGALEQSYGASHDYSWGLPALTSKEIEGVLM